MPIFYHQHKHHRHRQQHATSARLGAPDTQHAHKTKQQKQHKQRHSPSSTRRRTGSQRRLLKRLHGAADLTQSRCLSADAVMLAKIVVCVMLVATAPASAHQPPIHRTNAATTKASAGHTRHHQRPGSAQLAPLVQVVPHD